MRIWYIPLNVSYMDFVRCLHENDTIDVQMFYTYRFAVGDQVFIYSGAPFGQFLYQTIIDKINIPFEKAELHNELRKEPQKSTVNDWMRLRVLKSVPQGTKSLGPAVFSNMGFKFAATPRLIKDSDMLDYLFEEFDKYNCEQ